MAPTTQYVFTDKQYSVITLNRPEKRNAINLKMAQALDVYIEKAIQDKCNFLVIRSATDDVFCAGGDLKINHATLNKEDAFSNLYMMKKVLTKIVEFPVPTICLLSGDAYGGGCELATACDLRIAKEGTKFGFVQSKLGILPGWGGGTLLYEKVPKSFAFEWLTEGATFTASDLKRKGWIHKVISHDEWNEAELLKPYIHKTFEQMKLLKYQYKENISALNLSAKMNDEVRSCVRLWGSHRHKEALENFFKK